MLYELFKPAFPLGRFIDSFVYYKGYNPVHSIDRFLPDGDIHVIFDLTDYPKFIYDNETLAEKQACKDVWFSGIRSQYITIPSGWDSEMFIIYFRKGKSHPFLRGPVSAYTNEVVNGDDALQGDMQLLRNILLATTSVSDKFKAAERYLSQTFVPKLVENPFVDFAVSSIMQAPHQASINKILAKTGYSDRHMIQMFTRHVGLTPKAFMKVMRFQKVVQQIELRQQQNWTSVAVECGYYDQAHFIHDFKQFSGFTPSAYVQQFSDFTNYVAVG